MGFFDNLPKPIPARRECFLLIKADQLGLTDADKKQMLALVSDPAWSSAALCEAFAGRGFVVSRGVFDRHRARKCPCFDKAA